MLQLRQLGAGEAGRGFSVVAEEIRELAEESSKATNEIDDLIKQIQNKVSATTEVMNQSEKSSYGKRLSYRDN